MQLIVEAFLARQYRKKQVMTHPIDKAFQLLSDPTRPISLDYLADQACLSPRQFERKCHERLGLGPKTFRCIEAGAGSHPTGYYGFKDCV